MSNNYERSLAIKHAMHWRTKKEENKENNNKQRLQEQQQALLQN